MFIAPTVRLSISRQFGRSNSGRFLQNHENRSAQVPDGGSSASRRRREFDLQRARTPHEVITRSRCRLSVFSVRYVEKSRIETRSPFECMAAATKKHDPPIRVIHRTGSESAGHWGKPTDFLRNASRQGVFAGRKAVINKHSPPFVLLAEVARNPPVNWRVFQRFAKLTRNTVGQR